MPASAGQARAQYEHMAFASRIEGASPHGLVALLYEELLLALSTLSVAMARGDVVRGNAQFSRAINIVHSLQAGLDLDRGGPLAHTLLGIYRSALTELTTARRTQDRSRIDQLTEAFADLAEGWRKIAA